MIVIVVLSVTLQIILPVLLYNITIKKIYFDTNTTNHHHFYNSETSELFDIDANEVVIQKIPKAPNGKKIKNVEVFINLKN